jgi:prolyl-tRNA editing enzyme YbaK/EbsC (Cys-tRNA(Pro) deacylase)
MTVLSSSAQRVQDALDQLDLTLRVVELPRSTRTAQDAAQAIGCTVGQIAKSLVFQTKPSGQAVLVIASGTNRVDEQVVAALVGEKIAKADADFVRQQTGFAIGGVPPVGHIQKLEIFLDEDLLVFEDVWAAAGTPNAVFRLTPTDLVRATGGRVIAVQ